MVPQTVYTYDVVSSVWFEVVNYKSVKYQPFSADRLQRQNLKPVM